MWKGPEIVDEDGDYSVVLFRGDLAKETVSNQCERIRDAVQNLIQTYATAFRVDFQVKDLSTPTNGNLLSAHNKVQQILSVGVVNSFSYTISCLLVDMEHTNYIYHWREEILSVYVHP
ncbi:Phosphatidylinositol 4-phosphate 3-kinase C2 domain-containing subunit alpha [Homalodisca vitripennis]|nr:Phosphatidylinositol 4-phosphate 3-kinase C2 domain-containing subunit alpha [Homalodisca vitripennis]